MRSVVAPIMIATLLLAASIEPGHAQVDSREGITLQNQIYQLRQELKSIEDQSARGAGSHIQSPAYPPAAPQSGAGDLLAQLLTRVDSLEEQVRQLRGRIDETQNQLQRQNDDLGKRIDDLAFQINPQGAQSRRSQPDAPSYASQDTGPTQLTSPPRQSAPSGPHTPEVTLQEGNAALARRDYPNAEAAAREVLSNRTSPRAYDARLLLAQALYGERQFAQAAIAYDDAYNSSRKGSHAQDALLGLAGSLSAINEKKAACDTLTRLHTDFPQARSDVSAGAAVTGQKAGCH